MTQDPWGADLAGGFLSTHEGRLWVTAQAADEAVSLAVAANNEKHGKTLQNVVSQYDKELDKYTVESNELRRKWNDAESRAARLDRAESAMRDYEKTIAEQQEKIMNLTNDVTRLTKIAEEKIARDLEKGYDAPKILTPKPKRRKPIVEDGFI